MLMKPNSVHSHIPEPGELGWVMEVCAVQAAIDRGSGSCRVWALDLGDPTGHRGLSLLLTDLCSGVAAVEPHTGRVVLSKWPLPLLPMPC